MTHAERIVRILLEDATRIRGEYWIIDGTVAFADGDVGDVNHVAYAIDYARRAILDYFQQDSDDEHIDGQTLAERVVDALRERGIASDTARWYEPASLFLQQNGADQKTIETLKCAAERGVDPRDIAMQWWGWKWCRQNNISTWTFTTSDRQSIKSGLNEIYEQEGFEDEIVWRDLEITIGVGATGKRYAMTVAEIEDGRVVGVDPTWGGMEAQDEPSDLMRYMEPEVKRLTSIRQLRPDEEISNATFITSDLAEAGMAKLQEINPFRWQQFCEENRSYLDILTAVNKSYQAGQDYAGDTVAAHEAIDQLWELVQNELQKHCPPGYSLGSHPGSGSLIGCWKNDDMFD